MAKENIPPKCIYCDSEIESKGNHIEHIIPNCIGGKLKSRSLVCSTCNDDFGESIDAELGNQMNHMANLLNIKRERGEPPKISAIDKSDGKEYLLKPSGKPELRGPEIPEKVKEGTLEYGDSVTAAFPKMKQARGFLKGLKRQFPEIDVDEILKSAEIKKETVDKVVVSVGIGGKDMFRAIAKIAYSVLRHKVDFNDSVSFAPIIDFINREKYREI